MVAFSKVVGPKGAPKLSCECGPRTIVLSAGNTICYPDNINATAFDYSLLNAYPTSLSGQGDANSLVLVMGVSYIFSDIK